MTALKYLFSSIKEKPGQLHSQDSEEYQVKVLGFDASMVRNKFPLQIGSIVLPLIALESLILLCRAWEQGEMMLELLQAILF